MGSADFASLSHLVAALLVAAPLMYAAVAKLLAPDWFSESLPRLGLGFRGTAPAPAILVGLTELALAGALLLLPRWETALAVALAYAVFAFILERARRSGASGDCGCFGRLPSRIDRAAVGRNVLLSVGTIGLVVGRGSGALPDYETSMALAGTISLGVACGAVDTLIAVTRTDGADPR